MGGFGQTFGLCCFYCFSIPGRFRSPLIPFTHISLSTENWCSWCVDNLQLSIHKELHIAIIITWHLDFSHPIAAKASLENKSRRRPSRSTAIVAAKEKNCHPTHSLQNASSLQGMCISDGSARKERVWGSKDFVRGFVVPYRVCLLQTIQPPEHIKD